MRFDTSGPKAGNIYSSRSCCEALQAPAPGSQRDPPKTSWPQFVSRLKATPKAKPKSSNPSLCTTAAASLTKPITWCWQGPFTPKAWCKGIMPGRLRMPPRSEMESIKESFVVTGASIAPPRLRSRCSIARSLFCSIGPCCTSHGQNCPLTSQNWWRSTSPSK